MHRRASETLHPPRTGTTETLADPRDPTAERTAARGRRSTKEIIENHLACFAARNLEGILSDYASDAVLFTAAGPLRGLGAIRALFEAMLAEFGKPGARFDLKQLSVDGDHGFIVWTAETAENVYEVGTDTFVMHGGKIHVQSFAGKITPKR